MVVSHVLALVPRAEWLSFSIVVTGALLKAMNVQPPGERQQQERTCSSLWSPV